MGRYTGPKCRLSRREKFDLDLKTRPIDKKCNMKKCPGEHGFKHSEGRRYSNQIREKQKIKRTYGLREKQFHNLYKRAAQSAKKRVNKGELFLQLLEARLDNLVYRMGFAPTRAKARQMVSHKCIMVNDSVCNIPSRSLTPGDVIIVRDKAQKHLYVTESLKKTKTLKGFAWLDVDYDNFRGVFNDFPDKSLFAAFQEKLVVEFYSK